MIFLCMTVVGPFYLGQGKMDQLWKCLNCTISSIYMLLLMILVLFNIHLVDIHGKLDMIDSDLTWKS